MTYFTEETLKSEFQSREHTQWLESLIPQHEMGPVQENNHRSHVRADMIATEIYHGIIWLLEAYPQITRVRPIWKPIIAPEDDAMLVLVRLEIETNDPRDRADLEDRVDKAKKSGNPLDKYYSYADAPPSIPEDETHAFDTLIDLCEQVGPETWEGFYGTALRESKGYSNASQVLDEMESWLGEFLAQMQEHLMEKGLPRPSGEAQARSRSPGPRL